MRIAFVGKGGAGKTTLSALFSLFMKGRLPVLVVDADVNIHLPELVLGQQFPETKHLSHSEVAREIRTWLRGTNAKIRELSHFRKTTPPGAGSRVFRLGAASEPLLERFSMGDDSLRVMAVGTYDTDQIGTSCYHNDLAILENIISHSDDSNAVLIVDMVAGVDAFANTLHAQFDMLVLAVEPTRRGLEVYEQYAILAKEAGVFDRLFVVGNKVGGVADEQFIRSRVPEGVFLGSIFYSEYLRQQDQKGGRLDVYGLEEQSRVVLGRIAEQLARSGVNSAQRLASLHELHRKYVAQAFIVERFGDLSDQIDDSFRI